ncbi:MAG: flavodoxin-dependent (E)-4-hydroxy-3-methylbut-2-enyl-diphosphate synthase [candidate division WOR-3 bacterium]
MNSKKTVYVGKVPIGGKNPVVIQSMTNTKTEDYESTIRQIEDLHRRGAQIVRVSYPDIKCKDSLKKIVKNSPCPIIADIHFDYKLAISAMEIGCAKIRINPGNISKKNLLKIIKVAKERNIPIRIGVNGGSLEKEILEKYNYPNADALFESIKKSVDFFLDNDFDNLVLSVKSSDVFEMIDANMKMKELDFPIHLGVTEAGGLLRGSIKNSIGISYLLLNGVGDTIRVSLSESPLYEVDVAKIILSSLHINSNVPDVIACPTCSRTTFDVISVQKEVEKILENVNTKIKVAVMGCVVNGPGEAKDADLGITGGHGTGVLFKKGKIVKTGPIEEILKIFYEELKNYGK